jgi:hypothetical protein
MRAATWSIIRLSVSWLDSAPDRAVDASNATQAVAAKILEPAIGAPFDCACNPSIDPAIAPLPNQVDVSHA